MFVGLGRGAVGEQAHDEGDELHGDGGVGVRVRGERAKEFNGAAEFFAEFAVEGGFGGFAGFDLAAGEFPLSAEVLVRGTLRHEEVPVAFDEGAGDGDGSGSRRVIHSELIWNSGNQERTRRSKRNGIGQSWVVFLSWPRRGFAQAEFHLELRKSGRREAGKWGLGVWFRGVRWF